MTSIKRLIPALALLVCLSAHASTQQRVRAAIDPLFSRKSDAPWIVLAGAMAADVITTEQAMHRGCVESNPIYGRRPSLGKLVAFHGLVLGLQWPLRKHRVIYAEAALFTAAAIHNTQVRCRP